MPSIDAHCGNNATMPFCYDSAWAISCFCFLGAFVFGVSQIATRTIMAKKASTQVMMHGVNSNTTYSVKRGRTRLIPEMLTVSFLFRAVWFFMKGAPGEPWACYDSAEVSFPDASHYGNWKYALREMFNRFATLMSFSAFTVLVIFWAGTSTISGKFKVGDVSSNSRLAEFTPGSHAKRKPKYTCCQGVYVSLNVWLYLVLIGITVVNFIPNDLNDKCIPVVADIATPKSNVSCWCQVANATAPVSDRAAVCLVNRSYVSGLLVHENHTYTWRDQTPWSTIYETTILFTNALYGLLVIGLSVFGYRVMRALKGVHTAGAKGTSGGGGGGGGGGAGGAIGGAGGDQLASVTDDSDVEGADAAGGGGGGRARRHRRPQREKKQHADRTCGIATMRCKILVMIVTCCLCFSARFVLFAWPYVAPAKYAQFTGLACTVIRPYFQYVVVELAPALLLLIVMHPVANRSTRPKFSSGNDLVAPNNAEALVVTGNRRAVTYLGEPFLAANDPKSRI